MPVPTNPSVADAVWRRPATLDELRTALDAFTGWDALERARRAPELIEAAKAVLADERGAAMAEAKNVQGVTALARDLGITRQKVYDAINRVSGTEETGQRPAAETEDQRGQDTAATAPASDST